MISSIVILSQMVSQVKFQLHTNCKTWYSRRVYTTPCTLIIVGKRCTLEGLMLQVIAHHYHVKISWYAYLFQRNSVRCNAAYIEGKKVVSLAEFLGYLRYPTRFPGHFALLIFMGEIRPQFSPSTNIIMDGIIP